MLEPILQDLKSNFSQVPPAVAFSRLLMAAILGGIVGMGLYRVISDESPGS